MKQQFYRLTNLKKYDAEYNILLGERSNGKSYAVKEEVIKQAWNDADKKFILLRRWDLEVKPSLIETYFKDAPLSVITDGKCDGVVVWQGKIFLTKYNEENNKNEKIKIIGYTMALSMEQHYTSGVYTDVKNIVFEEFISRDYYLPAEPLKLMQFVSTVARRNRIKVYMIGNTISRLCPYFSEWQLLGIPKQKQGTIDIYTYTTPEIDENGNEIKITIAVEYCKNSGHNSAMFFGNSTKMITGGQWQSKEVPHLPEPLYHYTLMYHMVIKIMNFKFFCRLLSDKTGNVFWYIEPKTTDIPDVERVITDDIFYIMSHTYATNFTPLSESEKKALDLIKNNKIYFSDNLTGADFSACIKTLL